VLQDFTLDKSYTRSEKIELNDSKLAQSLIKQKYKNNMALVDQIDKLACGAGDALGTGQQACPIDWDRISTIKRVKFTQILIA
jgi:hypothetical protein